MPPTEMMPSIQSTRPAARSKDVRIPALDAMLMLGWSFVALGLLLGGITVYLLVTAETPAQVAAAMASIFSIVGSAAFSLGILLLFTGWILTAVKQMFHAQANGWRE